MLQVKNWEKLRIQAELILIMLLDPLASLSMQLSTGFNGHIPMIIPSAFLAVFFFLAVKHDRPLSQHVGTFILFASMISAARLLFAVVSSNFNHGVYINIGTNAACWFIAQVNFRNCLIFAVFCIVSNIVMIGLVDKVPFDTIAHLNAVSTIFIVAALIMWIYFGYQKKLLAVNQVIALQVDHERSTSERLVTAAEKLDVSVQSQGSALVETSASVDEIKATSGHNLDSLRRSRDLIMEFSKSAVAVMNARQNIEKNLDSIGLEVDQLSHVVDQSKIKFEELAAVLVELSRITRIVNDLVFQSRLLSFNASIEAARAGEHGKGFSVVAEEVGTLAQSSGAAAQEIDKILGESQILFQTVSKDLSAKMVDAHRVIANHINSARSDVQRSTESFDELMSRSHEIKNNTDAAITAIGEIDYGLNQIIESVNALSVTNQDIIVSADDTKKSAGVINKQIQQSQSLMDEIKPLLSPFQKAS
jgi:methyl-accepting chemotaxis protein